MNNISQFYTILDPEGNALLLTVNHYTKVLRMSYFKIDSRPTDSIYRTLQQLISHYQFYLSIKYTEI